MMRVSKFDAWGNDFLVLDVAQLRSAGVDEVAVAWPEVSRAWCNRASGVGADGLLLLERIDDVNARMRLYNSDGSTAEMSGNGARYFAHALFRSDAARGERVYRLHTDAGVREVTVGEQDSTSVVATVDMGEVSTIEAPANWAAIGTHPDRPVVHVSVGNPHTVVGVDDVAAVDLLALGRQVPGTNLEIVEPGPELHGITMRVHERGAGITEACGTGACASAWAARAWGIVPASTREIVVHMDGGSAKVHIDEPSPGRVTLVGPSVFIGHVVVDIAQAAS